MQWRWRSSRGALQDMSGSRMFNCMVLSVGNGGCEQSTEAFQKQIDTVRDPRIHAHIHTSSTHPTCTKGHQVVRCSVDAQARARQHLWRAGLRKRSRCVSHLLSDRDRGYSFGGMTLVSVFNLRTSTGSKLPVSIPLDRHRAIPQGIIYYINQLLHRVHRSHRDHHATIDHRSSAIVYRHSGAAASLRR